MRPPSFFAPIVQCCLASGLAVACTLAPVVPAHATPPADLLTRYSAQAGQAPSPLQGQRFFTTRQGGEWSCASCHQASPLQSGRHVVTGKPIQPLAPAAHPERFTDPAKVEKWFRRNCKDVANRECSPAEKADVLAWLMSLKT